MIFSEASFLLAKQWLFTHGRQLDRARFAWKFEGGSVEAILKELSAYQNPDGGFGHALEPDVRLKGSSVIATTMALQVLREVKAEASHSLVRGAIAYLLETLDRDAWAWKNVPDHVNDAPHAPWWHPEEEPTAFIPNPGYEIVSHFHQYQELVPADVLTPLTEAALEHLRQNSEELSMHDVYCANWMRDITSLPEATQEKILELLTPAVLRVVETNPEKWSGYTSRPLELVDSPESPYYEMLREAVEVNLDYLIQRQQEDGTWSVFWSWGEDSDGEAWQISRREWQGYLIVKNLTSFAAFQRLAGQT